MKMTFKQMAFDLDGDPWKIPYWEIESGQPGPCLLACAALHGNEINGGEAVVRWARELPGTLRRGSVLAVPFANLPGVRLGRQVERPEHGKWQVWPGAANGNRKERVYRALHDALGARATHAIDLHSYEDYLAAEALTSEEYPAGLALGLAAALPFTRISTAEAARAMPPPPPPPPGSTVPPCTLERLMNASGRVGLSLELSGQGRLFPAQVALGVAALRRMAAHLDMAAAPAGPAPDTTRVVMPRDAGRFVHVRAPGYGLLIAAGKQPGDCVQAGDPIAAWMPEDSLDIEPLRAPVAGRLYALGVYYPKPRPAAAPAPAVPPPPPPGPPGFPYAAPGAALATIFAWA